MRALGALGKPRLPVRRLMGILAPLDGVDVNALLLHFPQRAHLTQPIDMLDVEQHTTSRVRSGARLGTPERRTVLHSSMA